MKKLIIALFLLPALALAQQPTPDAMQEYAQTTLLQMICAVHYERTNQPENAAEYRFAPIPHAMQHDYELSQIATYVQEIYQMVNDGYDTALPDETKEQITPQCDSNLEAIKKNNEAAKKFFEQNEDVMTAPESSI